MYPNATNVTDGNGKVLFKELSYRLNGLMFKTHNDLGRFRREFQYCEYFEEQLKAELIPYRREHVLPAIDASINRVDFLIDDEVLIDFKAKPFITKEDYYQMRRYLELAKKPLGMIVNFRQVYLSPKRVLNVNAS